MKFNLLLQGMENPLVLDIDEISYSKNEKIRKNKTEGWLGLRQKGVSTMSYIEIEMVDSLLIDEETESEG